MNRSAIALLHTLRQNYETAATPIVISGCIGPRGDGYQITDTMTADNAQKYHWPQIQVFQEAEAHIVSALTLTYAEEAIGITRAAQSVGIPVVISFTVETDGKLPSGQVLADAIAQVDTSTGNGPIYYMINCAHPTHFEHILATDQPWLSRIHGIRANASSKSHTELDEAEELDEGNPQDFGRQYLDLSDQLPNLNILGGCCGTDHRHIEAICKACL